MSHGSGFGGVVLATALTVGSVWASDAGNAQRIELLGYAFDPLRDGEPSLPASLRGGDEDSYALLQLAHPPTSRACAARAAPPRRPSAPPRQPAATTSWCP